MHFLIPHPFLKRSPLVLLAALLFIFSFSFIPTQSVLAASYVVNAADDTNDTICDATHCSLREAIIAANSASGIDTISFAIGSGAQTINLTSGLPNFFRPAFIDGTTQPGYAGTPLIELNGTNAGAGEDGLTLEGLADGSTIRGLIINNFGGNGIYIEAVNNNTIAGNYIGTNAAGTAAAPNGGTGISIESTTNGNVIGGSTVSDRNIISGNTGGGIQLGRGNLTVQGNYIGTDVTGTRALGNGGSGIYAISVSSAMVGGTSAGTGNIIRYNSGDGVSVMNNANNVWVVGNQISSNGGLGIDLNDNGVTVNDVGDSDTGGNESQNFPVITSAVDNGTTLTISGTLNSTANASFTVDLYAQSTCDASGYGEGDVYLGSTGVTTNVSGDGSFTFTGTTPANGAVVSATVSTGSNESSEFSACKDITASITFEVNTTTDTDDGVCNTTHCSLREAINAANGHVGADSIHFAIGTGLATIMATSPLPEITSTVAIDGTTQPGFTNAPLIEVNGTSALGGDGFTFRPGSDNSSLRGLVINHFGSSDIVISQTSGISITGNYIGTDPTGMIAAGDNTNIGIYIWGLGSDNITIGGTSASDRNLISGGNNGGVVILNGDGIVIQGNYIGTDVTGTGALGNDAGIVMVSGANSSTIGGTAPGAGNIIRYNGNEGISVDQGSHQVRGNQISNNGGLGIDLGSVGVTPNDVGDADNSLQNFPVITSAGNLSGTTTVTGTLNSATSATFDLDFYSQATCDASGYGEGETYLGSTSRSTDSVGDTTFSFNTSSVSVGDVITATATNRANETSEFSACFTVTAVQTATVALTPASNDIVEGGNYIPVVVLTTSDGQDLINAVSVDVVNLGTGTAGAGDHSFATTTITFNAGSNSGLGQGFDLETVDDTLDENDETLIVGLSNVTGTNANIGTPDSFTLTITDNDTQTATVAFSSSGTATTDEAGTTHDVEVELTTSDGHALVNAVTVDVSDLGTGTAGAGDYSFSTTTLTFAAGATDGSLQSAVVAVVDDTDDESDETVMFGLGNLTGTNASLGAQTDYTFTITDDDAAPQTATVEFSSSGFSTTDESPISYNIDVVMTTSDGQPLITAFTVEVSDLFTGSATFVQDYNFSGGTLVFDAGDASGSTQTPYFALTGDTLDEPDETVDFGLVNLTGTNVSLGSQTTITVTITDDEATGIPGVTVTPTRRRIHAGETRNYRVVLDSQPISDVTITISQPERCVVRPITLTFTPENWDTAQTVSVRARNFPGTRCRIRHTATGGGYDGVTIDSVVIRIAAPAWEG